MGKLPRRRGFFAPRTIAVLGFLIGDTNFPPEEIQVPPNAVCIRDAALTRAVPVSRMRPYPPQGVSGISGRVKFYYA